MPALLFNFSLFGDARPYLPGIAANRRAIDRLFPGARMVVHYDEAAVSPADAPVDRVEWVRHRAARGRFWGTTFRFRSADDSAADAVLVRDLDSVVSAREAAAVAAWLKSPAGFHVMRDHPLHRAAIMGGTWGVKPGLLRLDVGGLLDGYAGRFDRYCDDQRFLHERVWPRVRHAVLAHDSNPAWAVAAGCGDGIAPFPPHPPVDPFGSAFVGAKVHFPAAAASAADATGSTRSRGGR